MDAHETSLKEKLIIGAFFLVFILLIYQNSKINRIQSQLAKDEQIISDINQTTNPRDISLEERIDVLYSETPIFGQNQKALQIWKQLEPLNVTFLIENSEEDIELNNDYMVDTKDWPNTGYFTGQIEVISDQGHTTETLNMQGFGRLVIDGNEESGMIMEGYWEDELLTGYARVIYNNGDWFEGNWLEGKKQG